MHVIRLTQSSNDLLYHPWFNFFLVCVCECVCELCVNFSSIMYFNCKYSLWIHYFMTSFVRVRNLIYFYHFVYTSICLCMCMLIIRRFCSNLSCNWSVWHCFVPNEQILRVITHLTSIFYWNVCISMFLEVNRNEDCNQDEIFSFLIEVWIFC